MGIQIGTAVAKAGAVTRGELRVGSMADGSPIFLPIFVASGRSDGPTVWLQAGIHGEEYGGTASIINFMRTVDVDALQGTIIGVPVVNPPSFNFRSRVSSIDGQDLNRIFPGATDGSYSFQLAAVLREHLERHADFLMDLHSGGIGAEVPFYVIYKDDGSEAGAKSKWLAKRLGCDTLWRINEAQGARGTVTAEALRHNIPSVTLECGGGTFTPEHLRDYLISIEGFMKAAGVLKGEPPVQEQYTIINGGAFIYNREGGLFVQECRVGEIVPKDSVVGRIINMHGDTVEEIRSPYADAYIAALICQYYPTPSGDIAAEAIPVEGRESL